MICNNGQDIRCSGLQKIIVQYKILGIHVSMTDYVSFSVAQSYSSLKSGVDVFSLSYLLARHHGDNFIVGKTLHMIF